MENFNKTEDNWIPLEDIGNLNSINSIHCDTRDFHCKLNETPLNTKDGNNRQITRILHKGFDYFIDESLIIEWINAIRKLSGGMADWRLLCFDVDGCDNWNLKYIRFYRHPKKQNLFVVCNREDVPIKWRNLTDDKISVSDIEHSGLYANPSVSFDKFKNDEISIGDSNLN